MDAERRSQNAPGRRVHDWENDPPYRFKILAAQVEANSNRLHELENAVLTLPQQYVPRKEQEARNARAATARIQWPIYLLMALNLAATFLHH